MVKGKKPLRYAKKTNGLQRRYQAEVKHKLRQFAETEYRAKRPLELRLLQLKPQIVFKKGTVLPNLLIKALQQTAYVIYLDYGAEIRFYFYTADGISMGASNFPKTEKLLNEMHGKANTLIHFPKKDPNAEIDTDSIQFQQHFKKMVSRIGQKYAISFKNLPTFAVKNKIQESKQDRSGIHVKDQIMHIAREYIAKEIRDQIILREIFILLTPHNTLNAEISTISTLWALTETALTHKPEIDKLFPVWKFKDPLTIKFKSWISKRYLPNLHINPNVIQSNGIFLFEMIQLLERNRNLKTIQLYSVILVWLMKYGMEKVLEYPLDQMKWEKENWILFQILDFIDRESSLLLKYQIDTKIFKTETFSYLLLIAQFTQKTKDQIMVKSQVQTATYILSTFPHYNQNAKLLEQLNLREFVTKLPPTITMQNDLMICIYQMIDDLFVRKGCLLISPSKIKLKRNTQKELLFNLRNQSDWILSNPKYHLEIASGSHLTTKILKHPNTVVFDIQIKLPLKISSSNRSKSSQLEILCEFDDPRKKGERRTQKLGQIWIEIED